jgi:hypothetical protein
MIVVALESRRVQLARSTPIRMTPLWTRSLAC